MGCSERPLGEGSQEGRGGGPRAGAVWASVGLWARGPPLVAALPLTGEGTGVPFWSPAVLLVSLWVTSPHRCLQGQCPPQQSPLDASGRTRQPQAQSLCLPLS